MLHQRKASKTCLKISAGIMLALFFQPATAELIGVYQSPDGEFTIEYRDDQHIRMERGSARAGFLLVRPEGNYMVMHTNDGWRYMGPDSAYDTGDGSIADIKPESTGRNATVAGIEGVVYRYNAAGFGPEDQQEMVLTDDPRVTRLTRALMTLIAGPDALEDWLNEIGDIPHQGLLRNDEFELLRIEEKPDLPSSRFELPPDAEPMATGG